MVFFQSIASVMRNHPQLRYLINPLNSFYALGSVAARPFQRDDSAILPLSASEHRGIVKAIASGDADAAGRAMRQHVLDSKQRTQLKNSLKNSLNNSPDNAGHNAAPLAHPATATAPAARKKVTHA